jgi:hypothetical protein
MEDNELTQQGGVRFGGDYSCHNSQPKGRNICLQALI